MNGRHLPEAIKSNRKIDSDKKTGERIDQTCVCVCGRMTHALVHESTDNMENDADECTNWRTLSKTPTNVFFHWNGNNRDEELCCRIQSSAKPHINWLYLSVLLVNTSMSCVSSASVDVRAHEEIRVPEPETRQPRTQTTCKVKFKRIGICRTFRTHRTALIRLQFVFLSSPILMVPVPSHVQCEWFFCVAFRRTRFDNDPTPTPTIAKFSH